MDRTIFLPRRYKASEKLVLPLRFRFWASNWASSHRDTKSIVMSLKGAALYQSSNITAVGYKIDLEALFQKNSQQLNNILFKIKIAYENAIFFIKVTATVHFILVTLWLADSTANWNVAYFCHLTTYRCKIEQVFVGSLSPCWLGDWTRMEKVQHPKHHAQWERLH